MADIDTSQDVELIDQINSVRANVISTASGGVQLVQHPTPLPTGTNYIGLMTVTQVNQPALVAGSSYIGLTTSTLLVPITTVNFLVSVASGGKTQFPSNTLINGGLIQADKLNNSNLYIGNSNVTYGVLGASGFELEAGEVTGWSGDNSNQLYIAAATGTTLRARFLGG